MAFRAFIAAEVELTPGARDMWEKVGGTGADLKMVDPSITHITLRFLGDTDEALVEDIARVMDGAVAGAAPFEVELRGLGVFPKPSHIKVVWLGMEGADPLKDIAGKLEAGMVPLGFKKEKPFRPHLTVARVRGKRNIGELSSLVESNADVSMGTFRVERIVLKKSVLTPQGPIYTDVREAALTGGETS
jgi:2'-5' RNA ligase